MPDIHIEKFNEDDAPIKKSNADINRFVSAHLPLREEDKVKFLRQCLIEQRRDEEKES
jgi:hypothetical protein